MRGKVSSPMLRHLCQATISSARSRCGLALGAIGLWALPALESPGLLAAQETSPPPALFGYAEPVAPATFAPYPSLTPPDVFAPATPAVPTIVAPPTAAPAPHFDPAVMPASYLAADPAKASGGDAKKLDAKNSWVDISGEKWTVKLGGHVQMDLVEWAQAMAPPIPAQNYFEFRRLRLMADGTGYGVFDFRIQIDIEPEAGEGTTTPVADIKDAYLSMNELPAIWKRWRIGNFFVPYSLEQVTNDTNNIFLERSIPTQGIFAADREVGMALYGVSDDLNHTWTSGIFLDSISESLKERIDDAQGCRLSGRLTWLPYYDEASNGRYLVHLGAGTLFSQEQDHLIRFRARPQIHEGPFLIDTGLIPGSSTTSANLEFATVWGQFSVQSEWFLTGANLANDTTATVYGGYAYLSYFLTGENRIYERFGQHGAQFGRNVPFSNFFLTRGGNGWGAWEFKMRSSYLGLQELNAGRYNDLTVGMNWYWTDRIRIMFDWIHPWTSAQTTYGQTSSDILGTRFDFNF